MAISGVTRPQHPLANLGLSRQSEAHQNGHPSKELARLRRYGLIVVDEVGYVPFGREAAKLILQLVSSRYEHASLVLTSNLPFSGWGEVFGDQTAAAMVDRVVHNADVRTFKGASHRLRGWSIDYLPSIRITTDDTPAWTHHTVHYSPAESGQDSSVDDTWGGRQIGEMEARLCSDPEDRTFSLSVPPLPRNKRA